jgi:HK97 gp10 family phage protein
MAKCQVQIDEAFALRLATLAERTDEIIPKVLEAGGEVVLAKVKSNLESALSGESTGELSRSLGLSKARLNRDGNYDVKIGFSEPRSDGKSNAMLANVLEYGKHNQPPRPFLKPAKSQTKTTCVEAMKAKFESEVDGI